MDGTAVADTRDTMRKPACEDLLLFFTMLRPAVRHDLPPGEAITMMKGESTLPETILDRIAADVGDGSTLSEAIGRHPDLFPAPLPAILAVGERSADPAGSIDRCIELLQRWTRVRRTVQAAVIYPGLCLSLVGGLLLIHLFLNPLGSMWSAVPHRGAVIGFWRFWGSIGKLIPKPVTRFFSEHSPFGTVSLVVAAVLFLLLAWAVWTIFLRGKRSARRDRILLNLPLVGRLYRLAAASGFLRAIAVLLAHGLPADRAFEEAMPAAGNRWIERELRRRLAVLRDGGRLSSCLVLKGLFPLSLELRLAVGEENGELPRAVADAADGFEESLELAGGRLARMMEPLALILVGLVALLCIWMILPGSDATFLGNTLRYL